MLILLLSLCHLLFWRFQHLLFLFMFTPGSANLKVLPENVTLFSVFLLNKAKVDLHNAFPLIPDPRRYIKWRRRKTGSRIYDFVSSFEEPVFLPSCADSFFLFGGYPRSDEDSWARLVPCCLGYASRLCGCQPVSQE